VDDGLVFQYFSQIITHNLEAQPKKQPKKTTTKKKKPKNFYKSFVQFGC